MDAVYPYRPSDWCELKYSLRSLQHIEHDDVFIIGELPDYIDEEKVTYTHQPEQPGKNTYDVVEKLLNICQDDRVSNDFILMNDDFYFLEDQEIKQYDRGLLKDHIEERKRDHYRETLQKTYNIMKGKNLPKMEYKSFELHYPLIINKRDFRKIFEKQFHKHNVVWRTIYGNKAKVESETIEEDFKFRDYDEFEEKKDKKMISSPPEIEEPLIELLEDKFPEKSRYEKQLES